MIVALPGLFSYLLYSLLLCGLYARRFFLSFTWCYFVFVFASPLSIVVTLLREQRANLSAFRMFFSICACLVLSVFSTS